MEDEKFVFKERRDLPAIVKPMLLKVETESEEESEWYIYIYFTAF